MWGELSYNDAISPIKVDSSFISEPEKYALQLEQNQEVRDLFCRICAHGREMRHVCLAYIINESRKQEKVTRQYNLGLITKAIKTFHLSVELDRANRILENQTSAQRLFRRL